MKRAPCKDCPDRHEACWSKCEKHKAWKREHDQAVTDAYKDRKRKAALNEVQARNILRYRRRREK